MHVSILVLLLHPGHSCHALLKTLFQNQVMGEIGVPHTGCLRHNEEKGSCTEPHASTGAAACPGASNCSYHTHLLPRHCGPQQSSCSGP